MLKPESCSIPFYICCGKKEKWLASFGMISMHLACLDLISKYILKSMISVTLDSLQMIKHSTWYWTCDIDIASEHMVQSEHFYNRARCEPVCTLTCLFTGCTKHSRRGSSVWNGTHLQHLHSSEECLWKHEWYFSSHYILMSVTWLANLHALWPMISNK